MITILQCNIWKNNMHFSKINYKMFHPNLIRNNDYIQFHRNIHRNFIIDPPIMVTKKRNIKKKSKKNEQITGKKMIFNIYLHVNDK